MVNRLASARRVEVAGLGDGASRAETCAIAPLPVVFVWHYGYWENLTSPQSTMAPSAFPNAPMLIPDTSLDPPCHQWHDMHATHT